MMQGPNEDDFHFGKDNKDTFSSQELELMPEAVLEEISPAVITDGPSLQSEIDKDSAMMEKVGSPVAREELQSMLKSITKEDLEKINSVQDMIELLKKIAPDRKIPQETIEILEKAVPEILKNKDKDKSNYQFYLNLALSFAAAAACAYFGGPLAAIAARAIYTQAYGLLFGVPMWYQPSFWLVFMPGREHIGALAYSWGPTIIGPITGALTYVLLTTGKYIGGKAYTAGEYLLSVARKQPTEPVAPEQLAPLIKEHEKIQEKIDEGWEFLPREEKEQEEEDWVFIPRDDEKTAPSQEANKENIEKTEEVRRTPPLKLSQELAQTENKQKATEDKPKLDIQQSPRQSKKKG